MISKDRRTSGLPARLIALSSLCATGLLLLGCAYTGSARDYIHQGFKVGPEYRRPWAAVEEDWIDAHDERLHFDLPRRNDWWNVFGDPNLAYLIQSAYSENLPLKEAGMRVQEARSERAIAVGAFFPQQQEVFGRTSRRQISKTAIDSRPLIATGVPRAFDHWSTGFDAAWELDFWGKFRRNIASADALYEASIYEYDDILVCLLAETAVTYVELRTAQQRLEYARANVSAQKGLLEIAESRFKAGETDDLDVLQATINVKNTEALIPELLKMERDSQIQLCVLRGRPPYDLDQELGNGPIPTAPVDVNLGMPADLLRRRPDVRKAERELASQSEQIGVAAADLLPQLSIRGSIGYGAEDLSDLFRSSSSTGVIAPGFDWAVLNYGRIKNNVIRQDQRFQQQVFHYRQTVLSANADVERAVVSFLQSQQRTISLADSVKANQEAIKVASDQYTAGEIDFNEIFTLQSFLVQEQDALAMAQGDVARSLIRIYKALGGGWELRCHCVDTGDNYLVATPGMISEPPEMAPPIIEQETGFQESPVPSKANGQDLESADDSPIDPLPKPMPEPNDAD